jgi:hypothetical protein
MIGPMGEGASAWREGLVQPLLAAYAAAPDVAAVALSGSAARRAADRWSDVEVMVFWSRPPGEAERVELAESAGAAVRRCFAFDEPEQVWADDLGVGPDELLVEVTHMLVSTAEEQLDRLLRRFDSDPLLLNFAQGVLDAVPAHGSALLEGWQGRLATYPDELQLAAIRRSAQIDHFWRWQMYAERRNPMLLASAMGEVAGRLYATVLALNKKYGPSLKSPDALSHQFDVAPPDFAARLRESFALPAAEQAAALAALAAETYDLIERHLPAVDVARLREIFQHERAPAGPAD